MPDIARLTGSDNYFEDFRVGEVFEHFRGKTIGEHENTLITHMSMNTAQSHFNEDAMRGHPAGQRVVFGGVTIAVAIGLTMQDTGENAIAEVSLTKVRLKARVVHGDSIKSFSKVLRIADQGCDAGNVTFQHWAINQHGEKVFEAERVVRIRRRPLPGEQGRRI